MIKINTDGMDSELAERVLIHALDNYQALAQNNIARASHRGERLGIEKFWTARLACAKELSIRLQNE